MDGYEKKYLGVFTIGLGYKRYFYNYKRINLYFGVKGAFVHQFAGNKTYENYENWEWDNAGTGNGFGAWALTGIDFSIYKGLYLGAEINLGFKDVIYTDITYKTNQNGTESSTKQRMGGHAFEGGFSVSPMFRLGWRF